jgi:hypothetical protein
VKQADELVLLAKGERLLQGVIDRLIDFGTHYEWKLM